MDTRSEFEPEERYSPEEQRRILELASRLQAQREQHANRSEIETAAMSLGIDARSVDEAIRQLHSPADANELSLGSNLSLLCGAFLVAQFTAVWGMLRSDWFSFVAGPGAMAWLAFAMAFVLGVSLSGRKRALWIGIGLVLCSTLVLAVLIGGFMRLSYNQTGSDWPISMLKFVAIEAAAYALGTGVGRLAKHFSKIPNAGFGGSRIL